MTGYSDGGGGWTLSSDRTQLTLVQPRSSVVCCNVSNQHGSLLSTARLAILPPGMTPSSFIYLLRPTYLVYWTLFYFFPFFCSILISTASFKRHMKAFIFPVAGNFEHLYCEMSIAGADQKLSVRPSVRLSVCLSVCLCVLHIETWNPAWGCAHFPKHSLFDIPQNIYFLETPPQNISPWTIPTDIFPSQFAPVKRLQPVGCLV